MAASFHRLEAQYRGWGVASWTAFLCVIVLLIFLPLGMAPGPIQPPSYAMLSVIPVVLAVVLILLIVNTKLPNY